MMMRIVKTPDEICVRKARIERGERRRVGRQMASPVLGGQTNNKQ
jgi:hypothetical protein